MSQQKTSLEDFFNLPSATDIVGEDTTTLSKTKKELFKEAKEIYNAISTVEKIDIALPVIRDLSEHDSEMDDIAKKAIKSFEDLTQLGLNVPDLHAGKIFEVAGQMLKTAMDAKDAKIQRKLRMIELQIKKARLEQLDPQSAPGSSNSGEFDRNEILKHIVDATKSSESDK